MTNTQIYKRFLPQIITSNNFIIHLHKLNNTNYYKNLGYL